MNKFSHKFHKFNINRYDQAARDIITSRWSLRVVSLFIAVAMWFFVVKSDNVQVTRTIKDLFEAINIPENTVVETSSKTVDLRITGDADEVSGVTPSSIQSQVNLKGLKPGSHTLPVTVTLPDNVAKVARVAPVETKVFIYNKMERTIPIRLEKGDDFPVDAEIRSFKISPSGVVISGADKYVMAAEGARVLINRENLDGKRLIPVKIVWKGDKSEADKVSVTPEQVLVDVLVHINKRALKVPLTVTVSGEPEVGFKISAVEVIPDTVVVEGVPDALSALKEVNLNTIDVSGIKEDLDITLPINLPVGAVAVGDGIARVHVRLVQDEVSRTIPGVPVRITGKNILPGWKVSPSSITFIVEGKASYLESLEGNSPLLEATVDASNIVADVITLPVSVKSFKEGIKIVGVEPAWVSLQNGTEE